MLMYLCILHTRIHVYVNTLSRRILLAASFEEIIKN